MSAAKALLNKNADIAETSDLTGRKSARLKKLAMGAAKGAPFPEDYSEKDIRIESSTCTGEKTIGFYSPADKKLHYAELVRTPADIRAFYAKYGCKAP